MADHINVDKRRNPVNPVDVFFSKGNINAIYGAIQTHLTKKYNTVIGREFLSEMLEIMKIVVKPIKRVPKDIDVKDFVTTLNQQTLKTAIPIFEKGVNGNDKQEQQNGQRQRVVINRRDDENTRTPNLQGRKLSGNYPQSSQQQAQQSQELDELYLQLENERTPQTTKPQNIDFTKIGNTPQVTDPKYNMDVETLYEQTINQRNQAKDIIIPPPQHTAIKQLPFQTTKDFKISDNPLYRTPEEEGDNKTTQREVSFNTGQGNSDKYSTPINRLAQYRTPTDAKKQTDPPLLQERSVDDIYSDEPSESQTFEPEEFANPLPNTNRNITPPRQVYDFTNFASSMNNFGEQPPYQEHMRVLIPKVSRNTTASEKSNMIPTIISVDSRNKDPVWTKHNNYRIDIEEIKDVLSIELTDAQIPISEYLINDSNNIIYFEETEGTTKMAKITPGNYAAAALATEIENQMTIEGDSTYTVGVDVLQNKFIINSDGFGGAGIFNLIFYGGTENIGFERERPIYPDNSIGEVLGFTPEDKTGTLTYIGDNSYNLKGEKYLLLYLKEASLIKTLDSNTRNAFAKIVLDPGLGETKFYNNNIDNKFIKYFSPPIGRLAHLTLEFRKQNGRLYDFNGQSNSLTFEIVTKDNTTDPYQDE